MPCQFLRASNRRQPNFLPNWAKICSDLSVYLADPAPLMFHEIIRDIMYAASCLFLISRLPMGILTCSMLAQKMYICTRP
ncbi:hypothetical protein GDO86_012584 [Hymenochirus boettgeri]|uniref:Uncharacterized protein n=1 Tax=Hymenochirus boettgeri TaxID=247094 RepID=A0A8T2IUY4_9PIPI|nr:hypothetical protein GDO86_012584 [Hymenochirus boettgeri]